MTGAIIGATQYQYRTSLGNSEEWLCYACIASGFPFANISSINDSPSISYASSSLLNDSDGTVTHRGFLQCCILNARSVMNKKLDIQALLVAEQLDVLAVTETFLGD